MNILLLEREVIGGDFKMSNCGCIDTRTKEFNSLIFNAGAINDGTETTPDTVPLGSANSNIRIAGWFLL